MLKSLSCARSTNQSDMAQSIRAQQSRKRNLAEQAFTLSRRHDDWIGVSESIDMLYVLF